MSSPVGIGTCDMDSKEGSICGVMGDMGRGPWRGISGDTPYIPCHKAFRKCRSAYDVVRENTRLEWHSKVLEVDRCREHHEGKHDKRITSEDFKCKG